MQLNTKNSKSFVKTVGVKSFAIFDKMLKLHS